jgi:thiamine-monophosphate kinase
MPDAPFDAELTVAQLGEFGLIDRLARILSTGGRDPLRPESSGQIGIGDDAALWEPRPGYREVLTTDALIEDVHFRHATTTWRELGWKALAENVSDIAAMGARPTRAFITLGLRPETRVADLEELYRGMADLESDCWREHTPDIPGVSFAFAGGDTVSSPITIISITVVGELDGDGLRRAAGRPGDLLAVTGTLGGSAGGLTILEAGDQPLKNPDVQRLVEMHRRPKPRVPEGLALAAVGVRCGMDLSDGLLGDAGKLAYASELSANLLLHELPLPSQLTAIFGEHDARMLALAGGEDYELLVAAPPGVIERAGKQLAELGLMRLTVVGRLEVGEPGKVTILDEHGQSITPPRGSWDHFRTGGGDT